MSSEESFQVIEVPVKRVEAQITLDDVLDALTRHATAGPADPAVTGHLERISQLAVEMKGVLSDVGRLDPTLHAQLQTGSPEPPA